MTSSAVRKPRESAPLPAVARWQRRWTPPLPVVVFLVGAAGLGSEIAAARLIAPYFGASTLVWANTIAVVLVALSAGYWLGGRWADRHPTQQGLATVIVVAAVALGVVPFVAEPFLQLSGRAFASLSLGIFAGSLIALLALVAVPMVLIGTVAPWAVRLGLRDMADAGRTTGRLYAISTAGSLAGTFAASLALIPYAGTRRTFLAFALGLAVVAVPTLARRALVVPALLVVALLAPQGVIKPAAPGTRVLYETETTYQYARVLESTDGTRTLELNEGQAVHSVYHPDTVLTGGYWDSLLTLPGAVLGRAPRSMAVLGNAAGTVDRAYARYFPDTTIDAVEIDPALTRIGLRYFGLQRRPQLHLTTADARPWLRVTPTCYDVIVIDAYRQPYIPFYLTTRQFFSQVRDHLTPGGLVLVNVGQPIGQTGLERVLAATLGSVFGQVARDPVVDTNTMLLASQQPISAAGLRGTPYPTDLTSLAAAEAAKLGPPLAGGEVYTDDRAPVEQLIDGSLISYATTGGGTRR